MLNKEEARIAFRHERSAMCASERRSIDETIAKAVLALDAWQRAHMVYTYLSFGAEVSTRALIEEAWKADKVVALPRCVPGTRSMRWYAVESFDGLQKSSFGVEEPVPHLHREIDARGGGGGRADGRGVARNDAPTDAPFAGSIALVPGLAFDARGFRLGYGGGFYDGFICDFTGTTVGLCRSGFLFDDLALRGLLEPHDAAVDMVVTEHGCHARDWLS
ncbi:MAG: 5-formyltetrahydrofolate cyclo-ligase [Atopobiaceae bacterium]|nr:5-formyltetrahydrofolate cyclo-ligase [Atopobiaceae bacterium]